MLLSFRRAIELATAEPLFPVNPLSPASPCPHAGHVGPGLVCVVCHKVHPPLERRLEAACIDGKAEMARKAGADAITISKRADRQRRKSKSAKRQPYAA